MKVWIVRGVVGGGGDWVISPALALKAYNPSLPRGQTIFLEVPYFSCFHFRFSLSAQLSEKQRQYPPLLYRLIVFPNFFTGTVSLTISRLHVWGVSSPYNMLTANIIHYTKKYVDFTIWMLVGYPNKHLNPVSWLPSPHIINMLTAKSAYYKCADCWVLTATDSTESERVES